MDWKKHKKLLLEKPGFKKALEETKVEFQIAKAVIESRLKKGLSQKQLAKRLHTQQSVISRVENAKTTPSVSFLKRLAVIYGSSLQIEFRVYS